MGNIIKTLAAGDIVRKALAVLHNKLIFCKTISKEYDSRFAVKGAKNGGTLLIREPNQFTVRTGAIMDTQDVTETTQTLTVATQKGVDINFSSIELTLSLDDFGERILNPAMSRLAAEVDKTVITASYKDVYNHILGTKGSPTALVDVNAARAKLSKGLAPSNDRFVLLESLSMNQVIADSKALFQPSSEIARQYSQGLVGTAAGFTFHETEMIPVHTMGTFADVDTPTVDTGAIVSGTATIPITSGTLVGTVTQGSVFTVAGIFAVNPETKAAYAHLQQWTVTADATASGGAVTLAVSPTPITSGAKQNCVISTPSATAAVLFETVGGSGTISTAYPQGLAYQKDAFTIVTADLEMPKGVDFAARDNYDGIALRIVRNYDIVNDKFPCRIDVLFGYKSVRPEWSCRLSG